LAERLTQARESIREGELLYREKIGNKVVLAKLYHAMMYCLFALFDIQDIGKLTHADVIDRFEKEYVEKGIIGRGYLDVIRHAYDLTHECDCDHMPVPLDVDIETAMHAAGEFINAIDDYLQAIRKHR
jgi:uncharacterized protein (UPF0332 family)